MNQRPDADDMDTATEAVGDWPDIECGQSPNGLCRFTWRDNWTTCIHCNKAMDE